MSDVLFSIIIPCYNVEAYIDECINSVLQQTYTGYEIILIDDGSTDGTHQRCEYWEKQDDRIKLITQRNAGLSEARNAGIGVARGDYLVFVDSDDSIECESLSSFQRQLQDDTEVLITRLAECYPDEMKELDAGMQSSDGVQLSQHEAIDWTMNKSQCTWPSVKYIVRRDLIERYRLRFKRGLLNEDIDWTTSLCCIAKKYKLCSYLWYNHRMKRVGSITTLATHRQVTDVIDIAHSYIDGEKSHLLNGLEYEDQLSIRMRLMKSVYACLSHYKRMTTEDKELVILHLRKHMKLFRYASQIKHKAFSMAARIAGPRLAMYLLSFFR